MNRNFATGALVVSCVALVAAIAIAVGGGEARADLQGEEVVGAAAVTSPSGTDAASPTPLPPVHTGHSGRTPHTAPPAAPVGLTIPSLSVLAQVVPVGLEDDGAMEVPGADDAGWYRHGVAPGSAVGSAVIAAHVDYEDRPGVFLELARVEIDAEVLVTDSTGVTRAYRVVERYQVPKAELDVDELFRNGGPHVLTLVTCGGAFDRSARSYDDNVVVRAIPV